MAEPTFDLIDSVTLSSSASSVSFTGLTQSYRDLVVIATGTTTSSDYRGIQFNGDTSNSYYLVNAAANGTSLSGNATGNTRVLWEYYQPSGTGTVNQAIFQIFDYSTTNKQKPVLVRNGSLASGDVVVEMRATRWANTNAITSITFMIGTAQYNAGSTFEIYGVLG